MKSFFTIGEPMALLSAIQSGSLNTVDGFTRSLAGAEANVAIGMARLGFHTYYLSKVGTDCFGQFIVDTLKNEGVDTRYITSSSSHSTGMVVKALSQDGSDPAVDYLRKNSAASSMHCHDFSDVVIESDSHLHVTGISLALSPHTNELCHDLVSRAQRSGASISFDPNIRPALWTSEQDMVSALNDMAMRCNIVLPGLSEGCLLTGFETPEEIAQFYLSSSNVTLVVIKLGENGAYYHDKTRGEGYIDAVEVRHIVDTVGAGDAFAVGCVSALLENLDLQQAIGRATLFGATALTVRGDNESLMNQEQLLRMQGATLV
jgi:2-dehydro-3-deoxygluconokinase